jgi:ATP-dependent DNA ligase
LDLRNARTRQVIDRGRICTTQVVHVDQFNRVDIHGDVAHVAEHPAILLCFDVLTLAGNDLTTLPLPERRQRLEDLVGDLHPYLQLVTQTDDWELAKQWLKTPASVEGVVAKRADGRYSAGRNRAWVKVKRK